MESEEITKLVDGIYKNILDKFNPGTRQMISSGKAYLKTLHAAAAASRIYVDAITKLARQAQQATWSGCSDIGSALMQIVETYKETQAQQMNILKAFYVDLLVPLETNLEKDTKVIQNEQKKFLQDHKQHVDSYHKAEALVKKYRKKQSSKGSKSGNSAVDKELRSMQMLEEEKNKLDDFCEQSLKTAITQERRRYGFVLERQSSLAKHFLAFHNSQQVLLEKFVNTWVEIAKSREQLPDPVENMFMTKLRDVNFYSEQEISSNLVEEEVALATHPTRKAPKSLADPLSDAEIQSITVAADVTNSVKHHPLVRAKSDFNVASSTLSLHRSDEYTTQRPMSLAIADNNNWEADNNAINTVNGTHSRTTSVVRALYSYLSNGENQLSFLKGDILSMIGDRNKGWHFGENLRTHCTGWFPLTYTESFLDSNNNNTATLLSAHSKKNITNKNGAGDMYQECSDSSPEADGFENNKSIGKFNGHKTPMTKFGDSVVQRQFHQNQRTLEHAFKPVTPPIVPAPIVPMANTLNRGGHNNNRNNTVKRNQNGNASLHSSNDSGFSNDPPPAPDADYSDDDTNRHILLKKAYELKLAAKLSNNAEMQQQQQQQQKKKILPSTTVVKKLNDSDDGQRKNDTGKRIAPIRQSSSVGQLATLGRNSDNSNNIINNNNNRHDDVDKKLKRTKSLWKFNKKHDDVLEGMSLWKHRSLVDVTTTNDHHDHLDDVDDHHEDFPFIKSRRGTISNNNNHHHRNSGTPPMLFDKKRMSIAMPKEMINGNYDDYHLGGGGGADDGPDEEDQEDDDENATIMNGSPGRRAAAADENTMMNGRHYGRKNFNNNNNNNNVESDDPSDRESCIVINDHRKTDTATRNAAALRGAATTATSATLIPRMHLSKGGNSISSSTTMRIGNGYKDNHHHHHHNNDDSDSVFESSKLLTFQYNRIASSAATESSWYDSWGDRKKK